MITYRNKGFITRDHDCTQILFCQTSGMPPNDGIKWVECEEREIAQRKCIKLWKQGDATYYGYL